MKWDSLSLTNVLLSLIGIMLFVLLLQKPSTTPALTYGSFDAPMMREVGGPPPVVSPIQNQGQAGAQNPHMPAASGEFDFQNMVFAALSCPDDATITLADFGCKGDEAKKRRDTIQALAKQGLPPRAMFDEVIEIYGLGALTDEAKEIRRNNRSGQ